MGKKNPKKIKKKMEEGRWEKETRDREYGRKWEKNEKERKWKEKKKRI